LINMPLYSWIKREQEERKMENWNAGQAPDTKPGPYYVTAQKAGGTAYWLMRGPFTGHAEALGVVRETMNKACELDARAHWMEWGTARMKDGSTEAGKLNSYFEVKS